MMVGGGRLEIAVDPGMRIDGHEVRHLQQVQLAITGLWYWLSRHLQVHSHLLHSSDLLLILYFFLFTHPIVPI